eukprot:CAMPEP_0178492106 /NCGR_PEP_ID=MMETSP0696-20121128/11759_1 /TAXON_ID=265572 /ORGANISM="Extubocellulus spinifer, Strain CCMP396" /LENGTH=111 /DNA_ID=CAMNT_0020120005 /DNA_START=946 /DNA_END=1281 /DNA_ORIENTATION=-
MALLLVPPFPNRLNNKNVKGLKGEGMTNLGRSTNWNKSQSMAVLAAKRMGKEFSEHSPKLELKKTLSSSRWRRFYFRALEGFPEIVPDPVYLAALRSHGINSSTTISESQI